MQEEDWFEFQSEGWHEESSIPSVAENRTEDPWDFDGYYGPEEEEESPDWTYDGPWEPGNLEMPQ